MNHEDLKTREEIQGSSNRSFGLVFSVVFLVIAALPLFTGEGMRIWSLMVSLVLLVVSFTAPLILSPLNRLWTRIGLLLHGIISPIVLGILFFAMVVPMGILMRLFGKDPLRLHFEPGLNSYWIKRDPPGPKPESMTDQF